MKWTASLLFLALGIHLHLFWLTVRLWFRSLCRQRASRPSLPRSRQAVDERSFPW